MHAIILAAGRGSRMGDLTRSRPKPLVEVAGMPLLVRVLAGLAAAGIGSATVVVGYLGDAIEAAIGDGSGLGIAVDYRRQPRLDGTGGALLAARDRIDGPFLLLWSDILVASATYRRVVERFAAGQVSGVLAVNEVDDPWAGAAVYFDAAGRLLRIVEKPPRGSSSTRWNNAGVLALDPEVIGYAERLTPSARGERELPQAIGSMLADGRTVVVTPVDGLWCDVGTPADLEWVSRVLAESGSVS